MPRLYTAFLLVFAFFPSVTHAAPEVLRIDVFIDTDSLKSDSYVKNGVFYINAVIRNISRENQEITVWNPFAVSWLSDNPHITLSREDASTSENVTLMPDNVYKGRIEMRNDSPGTKEPLSFRLGFIPKASGPAAQQSTAIWTGPVTLSP